MQINRQDHRKVRSWITHCPSYPHRHCKDHSCSCILDKYLFPAEQFPRFRRCTQIWNDITLPSPPAFCVFNCYASEDNFPLSRQGDITILNKLRALHKSPYNLLSFGSWRAIACTAGSLGSLGRSKKQRKVSMHLHGPEEVSISSR